MLDFWAQNLWRKSSQNSPGVSRSNLEEIANRAISVSLDEHDSLECWKKNPTEWDHAENFLAPILSRKL